MVNMDKDLCTSFLKQIASLRKLKFLTIELFYRQDSMYNRPFLVSIDYAWEKNKEYCHIPRNMCSQILRSVSHLHHLVHLDVSGNNLTGCLSNFLLDSALPLLQRVYLENTTITSDDN